MSAVLPADARKNASPGGCEAPLANRHSADEAHVKNIPRAAWQRERRPFFQSGFLQGGKLTAHNMCF
jgi:hypothetical protein